MGGRSSKNRDLLESSAWLRSVVQHYQKRRHGVASFDSFMIEPLFHSDQLRTPRRPDPDEARLFRVQICFRNSKGVAQQVHWIVKASYLHPLCSDPDVGGGVVGGERVVNVVMSPKLNVRSVQRIHHEIQVYQLLLADISKYLQAQKNPRARFLLNIPNLIFHERAHSAGRLVRCHLVMEDVCRTKRCAPLSNLQSGMSLAQFKVFLGTAAQFHAVAISWSLAKRANRPINAHSNNGHSDTVLDMFPFLMREPGDAGADLVRRRELLKRYEKLLLWCHDRKKGCSQRELKLFQELSKQADQLLSMDPWLDIRECFGGVCLGQLLPTEVLFQYDCASASLFDLSLIDSPLTSGFKCAAVPLNDQVPACAAVITCHRIHFGHLLRELCNFFFVMAEPIVRERYLILMLQSYCHVLTMTMEMLDVDWVRHFRMTFHQIVKAFYQHVPQAILRAILAHMKLTDPDELESLLQASDGDDRGPEHQRHQQTHYADLSQSKRYVPLTPERIRFLMQLLEPVHKSV